jgi:two-component system, OmpR family, copper resistance phosphate regulon response regulator CusR
MKILLIDDDQEISSLIKIELENYNYTVDAAYDGINGEKLALENRYDLILLDVILPGMDGFELCKKIRHKVTAPILMLTSLNSIEDRVTGFSSGADDYLTKPFRFHELMNRINALEARPI